MPEAVRHKARLAGAESWLAGLPDLIARRERDWAITVGPSFGDSTEAFVAQATCGDGTPAVLKLMIPRDGGHAMNEIAVLRLVGGEGCVRLLHDDADDGAMLLERLGPSLSDLAVPMEQRHEILCAASQLLWRPAPECGLPTGADKARWLASEITRLWDVLDRPCSERAVADALACADRRERAHDDERAVLVHGDVHQWNALQAGEQFKLVDPDGLLADAEYDLGIIMREDPEVLHSAGAARERAGWLARRCGRDEQAIWEWGVIERVSTGLLCLQIDLHDVGREMLRVADVVAA